MKLIDGEKLDYQFKHIGKWAEVDGKRYIPIEVACNLIKGCELTPAELKALKLGGLTEKEEEEK